ncbi:MAG: metallophosphoesterase family protein [Saprospiraceae bacterium]
MFECSGVRVNGQEHLNTPTPEYAKMRKIAISDIHGCNATFQRLLEQLSLSQDDELYFLGDYIDRGPDSKGVIDIILDLQQSGNVVRCLLGNHEQMMKDALADVDEEDFKIWLINGGDETLRSYMVNGKPRIPDHHYDFFDNLELYCEVDEYIMVHAGLNFEMPLPLTDEFSMLWIRDWYPDLNRHWLGERIIVHGHTPMPKVDIENQFTHLEKFPVLNIDGGCVHKGKRRGVGYLVAFDLTNRELYFQENMEG